MVGERLFNDVEASVWQVDVIDWQNGESPQRIEVLSTPEGCRPGDPAYPQAGDPFKPHRGEVATLSLISEDSEWRAIRLWQAVLLTSADGEIPKSWPSPNPLTP